MNAINKEGKTIVHRNDGFSLVEVLIALAITLVLLAAVLGVFRSILNSSSAANQVSEITSDAQAALNLLRRDLQKTESIPDGGIPLSGELLSEIYWRGDKCISDNSSTDIQIDCSDGDNSYTITDNGTILLAGTSDVGRLDSSGGYVFDAVTPTKVNGNDAIIIIYEDDFARDISAGTTLETSGFKSFELITTNTVLQNSIRNGDFISLRTQPGTPGSDGLPVLQRVHCDEDTCDSEITLNLGSAINSDIRVSSLRGFVNVSILRRVTYFLKEDEGRTWLMRQVNSRPAEKLIPGILDFKLSYDIIFENAAGVTGITSPDDTANPSKKTEFFYQSGVDSGPRRVMDIRRVNVDITLDSDTPATPGSANTVKRTQVAGMAVRRASAPSPPPDPPDPPDTRPSDYNCFYDNCSIKCGLSCDKWSGSDCETNFLKTPHKDYDPTNLGDYEQYYKPNWYNHGQQCNKLLQGTFTISDLPDKYIDKYTDPVTGKEAGIIWMYYNYMDNKVKHQIDPIPMIWNGEGCNVACGVALRDAYAYCDDYPGLVGCVTRPE